MAKEIVYLQVVHQPTPAIAYQVDDYIQVETPFGFALNANPGDWVVRDHETGIVQVLDQTAFAKLFQVVT